MGWRMLLIVGRLETGQFRVQLMETVLRYRIHREKVWKNSSKTTMDKKDRYFLLQLDLTGMLQLLIYLLQSIGHKKALFKGYCFQKASWERADCKNTCFLHPVYF